ADAVGVTAVPAVLAADQGVDRAGALGPLAAAFAQRHRGGLVRQGQVEAEVAGGVQPGQVLVEIVRRHLDRFVAQLRAALRGEQAVDPGRAAVRDRLAENGIFIHGWFPPATARPAWRNR